MYQSRKIYSGWDDPRVVKKYIEKMKIWKIKIKSLKLKNTQSSKKGK